MKVHYIDTAKALKHAVDDISQSSEIGLDLEFDRNSFGYGFVLCLIQISTRHHIYLIDPMALDDMHALWEIFENDRIAKVIHNASEDVLLLRKNLCNPRNIWDTEKAAVILNREKTGLSNLLEDYFDLQLDKGLQRTNWRQRPLTDEQLDYAAEDVRMLLPLKEKLEQEIQASGKEDWLLQEGLFLEQLEMKENPFPFLKYKNARKLGEEQKKQLLVMYNLRESLAESLDLPPYKIMRNELLVELSEQGFEEYHDWKKMKGAHPQFRSEEAFNRFQDDLANEIILPAEKGRRKKHNPRVEEDLKEIRNRIRETYGEQCTKLILSQAVINDILEAGNTVELKPYAREILFETADDLGIDIKFLK